MVTYWLLDEPFQLQGAELGGAGDNLPNAKTVHGRIGLRGGVTFVVGQHS
jgi:hypothetical protein